MSFVYVISWGGERRPLDLERRRKWPVDNGLQSWTSVRGRLSSGFFLASFASVDARAFKLRDNHIQKTCRSHQK